MKVWTRMIVSFGGKNLQTNINFPGWILKISHSVLLINLLSTFVNYARLELRIPLWLHNRGILIGLIHEEG